MSSDKRRRRGQSMVEFALTLPVLLMIVLGIIETALVIQGYLAVQHAAREAARFATTYQPPRGACMDLDGDGILQDGINDDADGGDPDDCALAAALSEGGDRDPYCPKEVDICSTTYPDLEEEDDYFRRRVELIRLRAREAAVGLRIDDSIEADTPTKFEVNRNEPGFFGVLVRGYPSFQVDCNDPTLHDTEWDPEHSPDGCLEHPGLEGLPVQVYVRHNVQIVDPLYRAIVDYVPVRADVQMINEGVQVGFGDVPPPHFELNPSFDESEGEGGSEYTVLLNPAYATNILPGDETEDFNVSVTHDGAPMAGVEVHFRTDHGTIEAGGDTGAYVSVTADGDGKASVTLRSSSAGDANLYAWILDDGDQGLDVGSEPYDSALCRWRDPGHSISLTPAEAENLLPDERAHALTARVLDETDLPVQGVVVGFDTTVGGFSYSGDGPASAIRRTNSQGQATITIYGNYSDTAEIRAWIDDGDGTLDADEHGALATAVKTWYALDPYITASDYEVYAGDRIEVGVMDHDAGSYDLYWCMQEGVGESTKLSGTVTIATAGEDRTGIAFDVPAQTAGKYRFETHKGDGGCGSTPVARSADVLVIESRPDLTIEVLDPGGVCPEEEFTFSARVTNMSSQATNELFDVDFRIDEGKAEGGSLPKQWISGIGAYETVTVTAVGWVAFAGDHTIDGYVNAIGDVEEPEDGGASNWNRLTFSTMDYVELKMANFEDGRGGFTYADDAFLGTSQPYYADGERVSSGGYEDSGALKVVLGGRDNYSVYDMSGGWWWPFTLSEPSTVRISFRYNLIQSPDYEESEYSHVLMRVDDVLYGSACERGNHNCIEEIWGDGNGGPERSSGWQVFDADIGPLSAGDHTLAIGVYNNQKTYSNEQTTVLIDDVIVEKDPCGEGQDGAPWAAGPCEPPGAIVCRQLFVGGDFEDDLAMYANWDWQDAAPWPKSYGEGVQSLVLQASQGWPPECRAYEPKLEQTVTIPDLTGVCTEPVSTTLTVSGYYLIDESQTGCSISNTVDSDDELYVRVGIGETPPEALITRGGPAIASAVPGGLSAGSHPRRDAGGPLLGYGELEYWGIGSGDFGWYDRATHRRMSTPSLGEVAYSGVTGGAARLSAVSEDPGWRTKALLAPFSLVPGPHISMQSRETVYFTSFESGWDSWVRDAGGGGLTIDDWYPYDGQYLVWGWGGYGSAATLWREVDTSGYGDIGISFAKRASYLESDDAYQVWWYDGIEWHLLESDSSNNSTWLVREFLLPSMADNNPDFRVGFRFVGDSSGDWFDLDAVNVTGFPMLPEVKFKQVWYSVVEQAGTARITVTLSEASDQTVSVPYTVSEGTATLGEDYYETGDPLSFAPGETETTFTVGILQDDIYEGDEDLHLTLGEPSNAVLGSPSAATLVIIDDESPPAVQFASSHYTVTESAGQATITATLSVAADTPITVTFSREGGTATPGEDFSPSSGSFVFPAGATTASFSLSIVDDDEVEDSETVELSLSLPDDTIATVGSPSTATLTIEDDDWSNTIDFSSDVYTVGEAEGSKMIHVWLSTPVSYTVTVSYTTLDLTATAGEDYTPTQGTLTFPANITETTFSVGIVSDDLYEGVETLELRLSDPEPADIDIGDNNPATLVIEDDDEMPSVDFDPRAYSVSEDAGTARITARLSAASGLTATVVYSTSDGTATAYDDYEPAGGTLVFAPGVVTQTFDVTIIDDDDFEADETVELRLMEPVHAALARDEVTATLTIENDDLPVVDFSADEYVVEEDVGQAVISVTLEAAVDYTVTVTYRTEDGTAKAPEDYVAVTGTLTIPPGNQLATFVVTIVDDEEPEEGEHLNLILEAPAENAAVGTENNPAMLVIVDDEPFEWDTWHAFSVDFSDDLDVGALTGESVPIEFYGVQDGDRYGTWFYLDNLESEVCTEWVDPPQDPAMGTIMGTVKVNGRLQADVPVWAYHRGGGPSQRTYTLGSEDRFGEGTYRFRNILPGEYTVYAEVWVGGLLMWDAATETVNAGESINVTLNLMAPN